MSTATNDESKKLTRGYRNNNPLNIRYNRLNDWRGRLYPNTDGTFEQFSSMEYGYRAAIKLIRNYIESGYNTVALIISRWAPDNENNTEGYINTVCNITGFLPSQKIDASNEFMIEKLIYAMAIAENGYNPLPNADQIKAGWKLL